MHEQSDDEIDARGTEDARPRFQVRLPGFLVAEDIRLGEVIARATSTAGIRPCGGCHRRAAALNRWLGFGRGRPR